MGQKIYLILLICICSGMLYGQSIREAIASGQKLRLEWVRQWENTAAESSPVPYPRYPDQLQPGAQELLVSFTLYGRSDGPPQGVMDKIQLIAIPESASEDTRSPRAGPEVTNTRFRPRYPSARWVQLRSLLDLAFEVDCRPASFVTFMRAQREQLQGMLVRTEGGWPEQEEVEALDLPDVFREVEWTDFFCHLLSMALPAHEHFIPLKEKGSGSSIIRDYVRIDHPVKQTVISGQITQPAEAAVSLQYYGEDNWLDFWADSTIRLEPAGRFSFRFPLDEPQLVNLYHGSKTIRFYMRPGDSLHLTTNAQTFYRDMAFSGTANANQQFLLDFYHLVRGDTFFLQHDPLLLSRDPLAVLEDFLNRQARELTFLRGRSAELSPDFLAFMDRDIRFDYATQIWEAAYRFAEAGPERLLPELDAQAREREALLWRLPPQRHFDFAAEEFVTLQQVKHRDKGWWGALSFQQYWALSQLILNEEVFFRHAVMNLFRSYEAGALSGREQLLLTDLLAVCRDSADREELLVFTRNSRRGKQEPRVIRALPIGRPAPGWQFPDQTGQSIRLRDFSGRKILLHLGWDTNLEAAMQDLAIFRQDQTELPQIVHLIMADQPADFRRATQGRQGLFAYVAPEEAQVLRDSYQLTDLSNYYYLIDEEGQVIANSYDLGTPARMRGIWSLLQPSKLAAERRIWQKLGFWRNLGIALLLVLLLTLMYLWRKQLQEKRDQRRRQLLELELKGIRSQMNPHFLFNALSSIQNLIRTDRGEQANQYLGQFAGLMRKILHHSTEEYLSLAEEIDTLRQYCHLEALRSPFSYEFTVDPVLDSHNTYIPGMILQPIVENAILHGLLPKKEDRQLRVDIAAHTRGIHCTVTDNGIGLRVAQASRSGSAGQRQSFGLSLVRQRLELLSEKEPPVLEIIDRCELSPNERGTRVTLVIPTEN